MFSCGWLSVSSHAKCAGHSPFKPREYPFRHGRLALKPSHEWAHIHRNNGFPFHSQFQRLAMATHFFGRVYSGDWRARARVCVRARLSTAFIPSSANLLAQQRTSERLPFWPFLYRNVLTAPSVTSIRLAFLWLVMLISSCFRTI